MGYGKPDTATTKIIPRLTLARQRAAVVGGNPVAEDTTGAPVPAAGSPEETEQEWIARTVAELGPLSEWERERLALLLLIPGR